MNPNKIKQIEKILGTKIDGVWGDDDKTALDKVTGADNPPTPSKGIQVFQPPTP